MNSIPYKIYSGAGNDFVMINNIEGIIPFEMQKDFTIKICNEQFHQIDGVIFLEKPPNKNNFIRMNYYNRDGSYGAMCGNGARCISQFALDERILRINNFSIEAVNKIYKAEIKTNNVIKIFFPPPKIYKLNIPVYEKVHNFSLQVHYMDLGSEHLILFIDDEPNKTSFSISDLDNAKIDSWGRALRYHSKFEPFGANVNFIDVLESNKLHVRTYERGVERETLACGTGVISSALVSSLIGKTNPPVKVLAQSGEWLTVDFILNNNSIENLSLEGPAKKIGEGILKN